MATDYGDSGVSDQADVLRKFAAAKKAEGISQRDLAKRSGYSPSYFNRLLQARRQLPDRRTALELAQSLQLSPPWVEALLRARNWEPLNAGEYARLYETTPRLEALLSQAGPGLPEPDLALVRAGMRAANDDLLASWQSYIDIRRQHSQRAWVAVLDACDDLEQQLYPALKRHADRLLAYSRLTRAAALHHLGTKGDTLRAAEAALHAATVCKDAAVQIRSLLLMGDVLKSSGDFDRASDYYGDAIGELRAQEHGGTLDRTWLQHWTLRAERKHADLLLYQGRPAQAEEPLRRVWARLQIAYERACAATSLGWALGQLGKWDEALQIQRQGLAIVEDMHRERRPEDRDTKLFLEAFLGLAGIYLHMGNADEARAFLDRADAENARLSAITTPNQTAQPFHERGRLELLWARYYSECCDNQEAARKRLEQAERFELEQQLASRVRLTGLYLTWGRSALRAGNVPQALKRFEDSLAWATRCTPPNHYYQVAARAGRYEALLLWEPDKSAVDREEAEIAKLVADDTFAHVRTRIALANLSARLALPDNRRLAEHATSALLAAAAFNRIVLRQTAAQVQRTIEQLAPSRRAAVWEQTAQYVAERMSAAHTAADVGADDLDELRGGVAALIRFASAAQPLGEPASAGGPL